VRHQLLRGADRCPSRAVRSRHRTPRRHVTTAARYTGTRVHRVEDARLLQGRGTFVDDITRPGMLHACFVRSPFARARIRGIDTAAALALRGVRAVLTADDL